MIKLLKQNGKTIYGIKEYIVDNVDELETIKCKCSMGSKAYAINMNETYILSGSNEWVLMPNNSYDDEEIRQLIQNNTEAISLLTDLSPEDLNTFLEVAEALNKINEKVDSIDTLTKEEIENLIEDTVSTIEADEINALFGGDSQ